MGDQRLGEPKRRRRGLAEEETPRPPCATCGAAAVCEVRLEIRDLATARDAGVNSRPYWLADYRSARTTIVTRLCEKCVESAVTVEARTKASVDAKKGGPHG